MRPITRYRVRWYLGEVVMMLILFACFIMSSRTVHWYLTPFFLFLIIVQAFLLSFRIKRQWPLGTYFFALAGYLRSHDPGHGTLFIENIVRAVEETGKYSPEVLKKYRVLLSDSLDIVLQKGWVAPDVDGRIRVTELGEQQIRKF